MQSVNVMLVNLFLLAISNVSGSPVDIIRRDCPACQCSCQEDDTIIWRYAYYCSAVCCEHEDPVSIYFDDKLIDTVELRLEYMARSNKRRSSKLKIGDVGWGDVGLLGIIQLGEIVGMHSNSVCIISGQCYHR